MRRQHNRDTREAISIGAFQLFPFERILKKDGESIKLGSRAFDILLALADSPGETIGHTELIAKVWPNVFVEDVSLRVHVAALRKALEERDKGATYITSVPGRGYRLGAPTSRTTIARVADADRVLQASYPLPQPLADMVGRNQEVRAICEKVLARRFVTIVGPGGVGKTTVALSVAHALLEEFAGAVCFVGLGPVGDPRLLANSITSAFGLPVQAKDTIPDLVAYLSGKRVLLILDSCEHLIAEAAIVAQRLFGAGHELYVLATSREALRVEGEHIHILPSLISPPADAQLTAAEALTYPSTQLFTNRMASDGAGDVNLSDEDAQLVGAMCRKLGGNALAIELAAGRVGTFGIRDTAALLDSQFALLWPGRRTAPPRHQTLYATLDWSHNLLSETERVMLRRLSVFPGTFTLDAAQHLVRSDVGEAAGLDAIFGLLSKSLASIDTSGAVTRYRLLDTTRAYARTKLEEAGELNAIQRQNALYFRELLRATAANAIAPGKPEASLSDIDDIRAALRWAFGPDGDALIGVDVAAYSAPIWLSRALLAECHEWLDKAMAATVDTGDTAVQQRLRIQLASAAAELFIHGFSEKTIEAWGGTLERARALGDFPAQFQSYLALWAGEIRAAQYAEALKTAEKCAALAQEVSDADGLAMSAWMLGHSMHHAARFNETRAHLQRYFGLEKKAARLASVKATGFDRHVDALCVMSNTLWILGQPAQATTWAARAVAEAQSSGLAIPVGLAMSWSVLNAHLSEPNVDLVERDAVDLLEQSRPHSIDSDSGFALCVMGLCQARRGQFDAGVPLVTEGLRLLANARMEAFSVLVLAHFCEHALDAGRLDDALFWMNQLESKDKSYENWCSTEVLRVRGLLANARGNPAEAEDCMHKALELARRQDAMSWELRAANSLSRLLNERHGPGKALKTLEPVYARFVEGRESADLIRAKAFMDELKAASR
ncbi:MAG: winged helix-turn-helix domain-containing protein [Rhizomicrobium sp.]